MDEAKTVGAPDDLSLLVDRANLVSGMRSSLLSFNKSDPAAATKAIRNVTLLRVYHQVERIVKYTEMCDKIEDRMYQSIDAKLDNTDPDDDGLWFTLLHVQEKLQKIMIESHKLLEPYLNVEQLSAFEIPNDQPDPSDSFTTMILDQESREKVRTSAQQVLAAISALESLPEEQQKEEILTVQNKAQEALAELENSNSSDGSEGEE